MKKLLSGIATVALVAVFAFMALGSSSEGSSSKSTDTQSSDASKADNKEEQSSKEEQTSEQQQEKDNTYNVGDTLDANGLKITMERAEEYSSDNQFIQPGDGNKYIRVFFNIKNESGSDKTVGSMDFDCYADGEACESQFFSESKLTSIDTISNNRSTKGYIYYEVPQNAKDIEIEYETSWWTSKKAIFKVTLQ